MDTLASIVTMNTHKYSWTLWPLWWHIVVILQTLWTPCTLYKNLSLYWHYAITLWSICSHSIDTRNPLVTLWTLCKYSGNACQFVWCFGISFLNWCAMLCATFCDGKNFAKTLTFWKWERASTGSNWAAITDHVTNHVTHHVIWRILSRGSS